MKKLLCITVLLMGGFISQAQTSEKSDNIRKLLEVTGSAKMGLTIIHRMLDLSKERYPDVDPKVWQEFEQELKPEELVALVIPIYAKYYTDADITDLLTFYSTPVGQKMIRTMPSVLQEAMTAGQEWGKQLAEKAIKQLKDKGYLDQ